MIERRRRSLMPDLPTGTVTLGERCGLVFGTIWLEMSFDWGIIRGMRSSDDR
jgi:hypothetical protein